MSLLDCQGTYRGREIGQDIWICGIELSFNILGGIQLQEEWRSDTEITSRFPLYGNTAVISKLISFFYSVNRSVRIQVVG